MANIICFKTRKGLKNCSNRQLKVTAKHKICPDGQKNAHLENRRGVGHCPMCSNTQYFIGKTAQEGRKNPVYEGLLIYSSFSLFLTELPWEQYLYLSIL